MTKTKKKDKKEDAQHFKTCRFAREVGQMTVWVEPSCKCPPHFMHGSFIVSKRECQECIHWEARQ